MSRLTIRESGGFTLIEILVAVAIIGIIATQGLITFQSYLKKAKSVEGEQALSELRRLEELYFNTNLQYSGDLPTVGWNPRAPLKYYSLTIELDGPGPPPFFYQVIATANLDSDPDLDAWVLTMDMNRSPSMQHGCIPGGVGAVKFDCVD